MHLLIRIILFWRIISVPTTTFPNLIWVVLSLILLLRLLILSIVLVLVVGKTLIWPINFYIRGALSNLLRFGNLCSIVHSFIPPWRLIRITSLLLRLSLLCLISIAKQSTWRRLLLARVILLNGLFLPLYIHRIVLTNFVVSHVPVRLSAVGM